MATKKSFYAYSIDHGKINGITESWEDCKSMISGTKATYKKFPTKEQAQKWLDSGGTYEIVIPPSLQKGIYFDAGTGRGIGVEVKVTDENGTNLLSKVVPLDKINEYGNYTTKDGTTNNFGELLGCYIALKIALAEKTNLIFGDSKLILDYWSKGHMKRDQLPEATVKLADMVAKLRIEFEKTGGTLSHISGDINPADLGFHK